MIYALFASWFVISAGFDWLVRIEGRSADRTRHRIRLRAPYRRAIKIAYWVTSIVGVALFLNYAWFSAYPTVIRALGGPFVVMFTGSYVLAVSGLLRLLPRFAELRLQEGGLWWFGRFTSWNYVSGAEMDNEQLRIDRVGNKSSLYLPSMFWQVQMEGPTLLDAIARQRPELELKAGGSNGSAPLGDD